MAKSWKTHNNNGRGRRLCGTCGDGVCFFHIDFVTVVQPEMQLAFVWRAGIGDVNIMAFGVKLCPTEIRDRNGILSNRLPLRLCLRKKMERIELPSPKW